MRLVEVAMCEKCRSSHFQSEGGGVKSLRTVGVGGIEGVGLKSFRAVWVTIFRGVPLLG